MDKKKIVLSISIIVFMLVVILIYNLVIKKRENKQNNTIDPKVINEPTNRDIINRTNGTTLCRSVNNYNTTFLFTIKDDKIIKYKATAAKPVTTYGFSTTDELTTMDKQIIENEVLKELGLEFMEYKGVKLSVEFNEDVILVIDIDYSNCDLSIVNKLSLNFNGKYSTIIKQLLSTKEYKCE